MVSKFHPLSGDGFRLYAYSILLSKKLPIIILLHLIKIRYAAFEVHSTFSSAILVEGFIFFFQYNFRCNVIIDMPDILQNWSWPGYNNDWMILFFRNIMEEVLGTIFLVPRKLTNHNMVILWNKDISKIIWHKPIENLYIIYP